ncbi:MAG TPA: hypothetical protein VNS46_16665 [Nocardioides sp.]|nr:hypothetical protein [Nocardioides sp.]
MNDSPARLLVLGPAPAAALSGLGAAARDIVVSEAPDDLASYTWVLLTQQVGEDVAGSVAREAEARSDLRVLLDLEHLPTHAVLDRLLPGRSCAFQRVGSLRAAVLSAGTGARLTTADLLAVGEVVRAPGRPDEETEVLRATLALSQAQVRDLHQRLRTLREQVDAHKDRIATLKGSEVRLRRRARGAEERVHELERHPALRVARRLRRVTRPR